MACSCNSSGEWASATLPATSCGDSPVARAEAGPHKAVAQLCGRQTRGDAGEVRIAGIRQRARRDQRLRCCRMGAVELVAANRNRALAHERGVRVELSRLQQRQQRERLDAGAGMHHATSGDIEMVSREDMSRLDIDDHRRAATARHRARNRRLQCRNACARRCGGQCRGHRRTKRSLRSIGRPGCSAAHASIVIGARASARAVIRHQHDLSVRA